MENPYAWDTEELLNKFMNACGRAGVSSSGLVISFSAGSEFDRARYLRGVVLARIERVEPPFNPGDHVKSKNKSVAPSTSNGWKRNRRERVLPVTLTVETVYYCGKGYWELVFKERNKATADTESDCDEDGFRSWFVPLRFKAEDFSLAENKTPASVS